MKKFGKPSVAAALCMALVLAFAACGGGDGFTSEDIQKAMEDEGYIGVMVYEDTKDAPAEAKTALLLLSQFDVKFLVMGAKTSTTGGATKIAYGFKSEKNAKKAYEVLNEADVAMITVTQDKNVVYYELKVGA